jgi:hypothetical protein
MSDTTTTVVDYVKLAAALVGLVQADLGVLNAPGGDSAVAIETAVARLEHVRHVLRHVVSTCCAHCGDDMEHYEDGRAVACHIRFGDGTQYIYAWHPTAAHQMNQPRELGTVTTRNGTKKHVIVSAPGHLDAVSEFPGCDRPPRILGGDEW